MDWVQTLGLGALAGGVTTALGKVLGEHIALWLSPTARLKKAEAKAKADAPPPPPPPPQFVFPVDLALQSKHVELVHLRDELTLAQEALRKLRRENEELSFSKSVAEAARRELESAQDATRRLRETCDAQALELAKMSAELQLARENGLRLVKQLEQERAEPARALVRPDPVLPQHRVEQIKTRGGASATPQISERIREGKSNG